MFRDDSVHEHLLIDDRNTFFNKRYDYVESSNMVCFDVPCIIALLAFEAVATHHGVNPYGIKQMTCETPPMRGATTPRVV